MMDDGTVVVGVDVDGCGCRYSWRGVRRGGEVQVLNFFFCKVRRVWMSGAGFMI